MLSDCSKFLCELASSVSYYLRLALHWQTTDTYMLQYSETKYFLTNLIFENLRNYHRHVVLCTSLKSRRERDKKRIVLSLGAGIHCQNCFLRQTVNSASQRLFISTWVSPKSKLICLLWCLSPDRQSAVFAVQQFCALESGSFLLARDIVNIRNSIVELCSMNYNASLEPSGALTFTWDSLPLVQTTSSFCMVNTSLVSFRQTS